MAAVNPVWDQDDLDNLLAEHSRVGQGGFEGGSRTQPGRSVLVLQRKVSFPSLSPTQHSGPFALAQAYIEDYLEDYLAQTCS